MGYGIAADARGDAYVTGRTDSPGFPISGTQAGSLDNASGSVLPDGGTYPACHETASADAFAVKLDTTAGGLVPLGLPAAQAPALWTPQTLQQNAVTGTTLVTGTLGLLGVPAISQTVGLTASGIVNTAGTPACGRTCARTGSHSSEAGRPGRGPGRKTGAAWPCASPSGSYGTGTLQVCSPTRFRRRDKPHWLVRALLATVAVSACPRTSAMSSSDMCECRSSSGSWALLMMPIRCRCAVAVTRIYTRGGWLTSYRHGT